MGRPIPRAHDGRGGASALKSAPAESLRTASTTDPRLSSAGAARALRLEPLVGLGELPDRLCMRRQEHAVLLASHATFRLNDVPETGHGDVDCPDAKNPAL